VRPQDARAEARAHDTRRSARPQDARASAPAQDTRFARAGRLGFASPQELGGKDHLAFLLSTRSQHTQVVGKL
jgi:hypothetical protein